MNGTSACNSCATARESLTMPRPRKEEQTKKPTFAGFERPESNWFKMPTTWTDITASIDNLAELKVVEYILRHTWGYQEYELKKHITIEEFVRGRKHRDGSRIDRGTGLSERSVYYGLEKATNDGLIEQEVDDSDPGRIKKKYSLKMRNGDIQQTSPQALQSGVQTLHPPLQDLHPRGAKDAPRTEKDTLERNQQHDDVVGALISFGISKPAALKIANTYPEDYVLQKLDLAQWLMETRSSQVARNPAGYLRRAIEEDYLPPPQYKSAPQRAAQEEQRNRSISAEQEIRRQAEAELARSRQELRERLRGERPPQPIPGTHLTTEAAWGQVLDQLKGEMTPANFNTWLKDTSLVSCDEDKALVVATTAFQLDWLRNRLDIMVRKALLSVLGRLVSCEYIALSELFPSGQADRPQAST